MSTSLRMRISAQQMAGLRALAALTDATPLDALRAIIRHRAQPELLRAIRKTAGLQYVPGWRSIQDDPSDTDPGHKERYILQAEMRKKTVQVHLRLPPALHARLADAARQANMPVSRAVRLLLDDALARVFGPRESGNPLQSWRVPTLAEWEQINETLAHIRAHYLGENHGRVDIE